MGTGEFILAVFKEINYLTHQEFKKLNEQLSLLEQQPKILREKKKGDYLVENKMYVNAVKIYENALLKEDNEGLGEQFRGGIYHNMGCAYLHLFQFEEAAECFLKAYQFLHTKQVLSHYLMACCMGNPEEFPGICNRMGVSPQMQEEIKEKLKEAGETVEEPQNQELGKCLEGFIKEYHRSTGF